ncbi:borealin-2 isoform X2 [Hypomesus transpacificus]|uniref:borealin-2 isoform X2 n=1 Tax=Hypomesus transpacificus TaxID=137520 RepID=UPI001F07D81C|nr:borealin-2 isoform X2 [Hypomesus transpacificus]
MTSKRTRKVSAEGHFMEQMSEMRQKKAALFIQQFEKDAQDRINEMVSKMEQNLATVDRVFKVELMKMPPALQNTLIKDLINGGLSAGDVTIAVKNESPEMDQPLTRKHSGKKVKVTDGAPKRITGSQTRKTLEAAKKATNKTRSLVTSSSAGSLRCASTSTCKRAVSRIAKTSDQSALSSKQRAVLLSSGNDRMSCFAAGSAPYVTISTSLGETVCLSEETKDEIDVRQMDEMAVLQMQRLMKLMVYLANKFKLNSL